MSDAHNPTSPAVRPAPAGDRTTASPAEVSTLTPADQVRLYRALSHMPFSGNLTPHSAKKVTVDTIIDTLEKVADRLKEHVHTDEKRDAELTRLMGLMAGGRHLLTELLK